MAMKDLPLASLLLGIFLHAWHLPSHHHLLGCVQWLSSVWTHAGCPAMFFVDYVHAAQTYILGRLIGECVFVNRLLALLLLCVYALVIERPEESAHCVQSLLCCAWLHGLGFCVLCVRSSQQSVWIAGGQGWRRGVGGCMMLLLGMCVYWSCHACVAPS